jgi:hypothetical protein
MLRILLVRLANFGKTENERAWEESRARARHIREVGKYMRLLLSNAPQVFDTSTKQQSTKVVIARGNRQRTPNLRFCQKNSTIMCHDYEYSRHVESTFAFTRDLEKKRRTDSY